MRIHSVEVVGFGPFLARQRVDFEAFADHGIFLVQGRTGAGKSSILDAVVYALYNGAPRYGSRAADHLRSQHCTPGDPTWVELEFTVDERRYRVRRSPEYPRPKARGGGLTTERATARLWRRDGEGWTALEASVRTVGQALEQLLPLTQTQFLQVVMLAQGQFERFLVAESAERKQLLGTLFDTRRFEVLDSVLQERVSTARAAIDRATSATDALLAALSDHLGVERPEIPDEAWLDEVTTQAAHEESAAVQVRDAAWQALDAARTRFQELQALEGRQRRRAGLVARHTALQDEHEAVQRERRRLERAVAARAVRPVREAHDRVVRRAGEVRAEVAKAAARYEETFGAAVPDDLTPLRDSLVSTLATVSRALGVERRLEESREGLRRSRTSVEELDRRQAHLAATTAQHQEVLRRPPETTPEEAERSVHALMDEVARATRHEDAVAQRQAAEVSLLRAGEERTSASTVVDELRRRALEQYAGRLAEQLVEGSPCQVCGSREHPEPAALGGDPVHEDDVEAAERAFDTAQDDWVRAKANLAAARANEAAHASALGVDRAKTLLEEATERHRRVVEDQQARDRAERALVDLAVEVQQFEVERAGLTVRIEALTETVERLSAEVDEARGNADSVAERCEALRAELEVVEEVLDTSHRAERAEGERELAVHRLADDLARHGFDSPQEATDAELPPEAVERGERAVRAHDDARAVVSAGLADPELQGLPVDPVDLTETSATLAAATARHEEAAASAGMERQRRETADRIARGVRTAWTRHAAERRELDVLRRLAASVHGEPPNVRRMRLESYVLAVELEQIVLAANRRLAVMSTGRYELLLADRVATRGNNAGLEVRVLDQHTQESRTPESLSGGEKFLASLSLALGLAEVVTERAGGVRLDTLFIDEGFGSLDAETLDLAMHSLDQLREHGRVVGVISHVEAMKERIPAQLVVETTSGGWSTVRTEV